MIQAPPGPPRALGGLRLWLHATTLGPRAAFVLAFAAPV